jgi:YidC/Oxa1 family membrane protein insertase
MGLVILILTLVVKILLLPIAYKTYMSGARMRVLKPETDALAVKFEKNPDPMKKQQEQMALYRKAGVNPLSGCLPLLLQFPILIALFAFIPAAIELRQQSFLWADDLSTYDTILDFGYIPFINWAYGDHISLFAALMFVSTIIYTYMNSSMMPQQNNQMPGMKFMMYFMPVIFLAVMNDYAAGLSWYYFLANMFTFLQNWIMKKVISDEKIRAELESNMKKPVKVSNFQKRLEEMAKQRQQIGKK